MILFIIAWIGRLLGRLRARSMSFERKVKKYSARFVIQYFKKHAYNLYLYIRRCIRRDIIGAAYFIKYKIILQIPKPLRDKLLQGNVWVFYFYICYWRKMMWYRRFPLKLLRHLFYTIPLECGKWYWHARLITLGILFIRLHGYTFVIYSSSVFVHMYITSFLFMNMI